MEKQTEFFRAPIINGEKYDVFKCVKLLNQKQTAYYISQGVQLRDVRVSNDRKTGDEILVYYFYREDTREAFNNWCNMRNSNN